MAFMKQAPKRYFLELMGSLALYMAALWYSLAYVNAHAAPSTTKAVIALSPMLPICLIALAILRFYNRMDEMHRRQLLEQFAIAGAFMSIVSLGLAFGENAGLPHMGIIWAWPLMGAGWLLAACYRMFRTSHAERGLAKTLGLMARFLLPIVILTGLYAWAAPQLGWPHRPAILLLLSAAIFVAQQGYKLFVKRSCE